MKLKIEKLLNYISTSNVWLGKNNKQNNDTKLGYAMRKMIKPINKLVEPYNELISERENAFDKIRINNAATSETKPKVIIYDTIKDSSGNDVQAYQFTPAGKIKCNEELLAMTKEYIKKLEELVEQEVELNDPYYTTEVPSDLTDHEKETFTSIVIEPGKVDVKVSKEELVSN